MNISKMLAAVGGLLFAADAIAQAVVCTTLSTEPFGTQVWTSGNGDSYSLTQASDLSISGTATTGPNNPRCTAGVKYTVTGFNHSDGNFHITATNNTPPSGCVTNNQLLGSVSGKGCNNASFRWLNSDGQSGNDTMSHACYFPTGEAQKIVLGVGIDGRPPTIVTYQQHLAPEYDWGGRAITETTPPGTGSDSCWDAQAGNDGIDPQTNVTGGTLPIASGAAFKDDAGPSPGLVQYYRARHRVPCGMQIKQALWVDCGSTFTGTNFVTNDNAIGIATTDVTVIRANVPKTIFWSPAISSAVVNNVLLLLR